MRAVIYDKFKGLPYVTDLSDPIAAPGSVVIAVAATGLCRSDWHGWQGHDSDITTLPHVPGHEFAGTISAIGTGVVNWNVGDRVTVPFVCGCGECLECASGNAQVCARQWQPGFNGPGSFAELVAIPNADFNLVGLPEEVSSSAAAALGCRFATAFRAAVQIGRVRADERVVVFGCGGVGLSLIMIASAMGARVAAVDVSKDALALAMELGAHVAIESSGDNAGAVRDALGGAADLSFDALGSIATCADSVATLRPRGRHVQVGLLPPAEVGDQATVPMHLVIGRELEVLGSHGMSAHDYPAMLAMIATGRLAPERLVMRTIGLDDVPTALVDLGGSRQPGVTVIVPPRTSGPDAP